MLAPNVLGALRSSAELLRARPVTIIALGAALLLSFVAICCVLGIPTAPLVLCQLLAVLLSVATGEPVRPSRSWFAASFFLLCAVVLLASAAWLATLFFAPGMPLPIGPSEPAPWAEILKAVLLSAVGTLVALSCIGPFLYAPIVLLDAGGTIGGAALESARLVMMGGILRHLKLSLVANVVQLAPAVLAAIFAARFVEPTVAPLAVAVSLPFLSVTIPLGQGMVVAAYLERRHLLTLRPTTRGRPSRSLTLVWSLVLLAPVASLSLTGVALTRSSRLSEGGMPNEFTLLHDIDVRREERTVVLPTALRVVASAHRVVVAASDEGGAGDLPLHTRAAIQRVRIGSHGDIYAIELTTRTARFHCLVDRAGVRLDDDLRTRLLDRVPAWGIVSTLALLVLLGVVIGRTFGPLGHVRHLFAGDSTRTLAPEVEQQRRTAMRRAWWTAWLMLPWAVASVAGAIYSLVG